MKASRTPLDENVSPQPGVGSHQRITELPVAINVNESGGSAEAQKSGLADNAPAKSPDEMGIDKAGSPTDGLKGYGFSTGAAPDLSGI